MSGQLNSFPLTELLREISAANLSGALRLARGPAKTIVYFEAGQISYATSNLRAYRLIDCVRRWNVLANLTEKQLSAIQGKTSDLEFGAALVEAGVLTREALQTLTARQVAELLCHALLWTDGEWVFDPRARLAEDLRVTVKLSELLMESARRLPAEVVTARFENRDEKLSPETLAPDDLNLSPTEAFVLTRVEGGVSIGELLLIGGLPEAETLRSLYALALGGFLRREQWPQALKQEELDRARAVKSATATHVAPAQPQPKATEAKSAAVNQGPAAPQEKPREENEPEDLFARLDIATNHYQILGVVRSAEAADIKRAYHSLAKRFHPDRFRKTADAALLSRIESGFAQIAQAYETLKDKTTRAAYDSKLLKRESAPRTNVETRPTPQPTTSPREATVNSGFGASAPQARPSNSQAGVDAEEKFQQGFTALLDGNLTLAIASLGEAARLVPSQPRYRAYYGRALSGDERLRRSAEAEFKAAIELDATNASYRVMLAELYTQIGLVRRAQGELERALAVDPKNEAARRLLDKLKR